MPLSACAKSPMRGNVAFDALNAQALRRLVVGDSRRPVGLTERNPSEPPTVLA